MDQSSPSRFIALDSLRGLCACAVVIHHIHSVGHLTNFTLFKQSWLFVDFFFVLSGFVISAAYNDRLSSGFSVREFMLLRLGRIYPLHLFMLLVFLMLETSGVIFGSTALNRGSFEGSRNLAALISNIFLIQVFGLHSIETWNSPSWSIAAEFWTYLLFSLLITRVPIRWHAAAIVTLMGVSLLSLYATGAGGLSRTYSWSVVRCTYGFSIGVLINYLFASTSWIRRRSYPAIFASALEISSVSFLIAILTSPVTPHNQLMVPVLFGFNILLFAGEHGCVSRALKLRLFQLIGLLSYSIYMVHLFVIGRSLDLYSFISRRSGHSLTTILEQNGTPWKAFGGTPLLSDAMVVSCLVFTIGAAWLTYNCIEKPYRKRSRKFAERIGGRSAVKPEKVASSM